MARLNVHVPDDLAKRARARGLNVSALTQEAIRSELDRRAVDAWLDELPAHGQRISHDVALDALDAARDELEESAGYG